MHHPEERDEALARLRKKLRSQAGTPQPDKDQTATITHHPWRYTMTRLQHNFEEIIRTARNLFTTKTLAYLLMGLFMIGALAACAGESPPPPGGPGEEEDNGDNGDDEDEDTSDPDPGDGPRVESVESTASTTILVTFSHTMSESAEDSDNYRVALAVPEEQALHLQRINPTVLEAPALQITDAELNSDGTQVTLTTDWQAEQEYTLIVSGVEDHDGNEIDTDFDRASFSGTPPDLDDPDLVDSNGDGLPDRIQEEGWTIFVDENGDGEFTSRHVTSDPTNTHTGDPNMSDLEKFERRLNPNTEDTDGDGLTDYEEIYVYGSNPRTVDTAGDANQNGSIDNRFFDGGKVELGLSPILTDSTGDGRSDWDLFINPDRDPHLAYIPTASIEAGDKINLIIDYDYTITREDETTTEDHITVSHEVEREQETATSRSSTHTHEASVEVTAEKSFGPVPGGSVSVTAGYSYGYSKTNTSEQRRRTREAVAKEKGNVEIDTQRESITFSATGGQIITDITLRNEGTLTFTLDNFIVRVLWFDPQDRELKPLGTLEADLEQVTLAPDRDTTITGELNVSNARLMDRIMQNPSALVFEPTYFELLDQNGVDFAWYEESIADHSSLITIDYGPGRDIEKHLVATNLYRIYPQNRAAGMPIAEILERLEIEYETDVQQGQSVLYAVNGVQEDPDTNSFWIAITSDNEIADEDTDFEDYLVKPGQSLTLAYIEDKDGDNLSSFEEFLFGTSDHETHTPGLPEDEEDSDFPFEEFNDYFKAKVGWDVRPEGQDAYHVLPDPATLDSNDDGCSDYNNWVMGTDPYLVDTSGDGIADCTEDGERRTNALRYIAGPRIEDLTLVLGPYSDEGREVTVTATIVKEIEDIGEVVVTWDEARELTKEFAVGGQEEYTLEATYTYREPTEEGGVVNVLVAATDTKGATRQEAISRRIVPEFEADARADINARGHVHDLAWSFEGDYLGWASGGHLRVYRVDEDLQLKDHMVLGSADSKIEGFAWHPDKNNVGFFDPKYTTWINCCVVEYSVEDEQVVNHRDLMAIGSETHELEVWGVAFLRDWFATIGYTKYDHSIHDITLERYFFHYGGTFRGSKSHSTFQNTRNIALATTSNPDWFSAATLGEEEFHLRVWDLENDALYGRVRYQDEPSHGNALDWSKDDRYIAATGYYKGNRLWILEVDNTASNPVQQSTTSLDGDDPNADQDASPEANVLAWDPTSSLVGLGMSDGSIRIYHAGTLELQAILRDAHDDHAITAIAWSPDGETIATGGTDERVRLWSVYDD